MYCTFVVRATPPVTVSFLIGGRALVGKVGCPMRHPCTHAQSKAPPSHSNQATKPPDISLRLLENFLSGTNLPYSFPNRMISWFPKWTLRTYFLNYLLYRTLASTTWGISHLASLKWGAEAREGVSERRMGMERDGRTDELEIFWKHCVVTYLVWTMVSDAELLWRYAL